MPRPCGNSWFTIRPGSGSSTSTSRRQTFPVHSHDLDGQLSIQVISGEGFFLGADKMEIPARQGEILVCDIRQPHGVKATTDLRILVTIAPPL